MPADSLDRIDDNEAAFAPIGGLAGTEDVVLVAAAKSGGSPAFEVLVERHTRRILRVAQRVTGNREDAEDIVQQSFQRTFIHLRQWEGRSSFSTWLTRVAINEALIFLRKSRRTCEVSIDDSNVNEETAPPLEIPDSSPDPEASYSQREWGRVLSSAMNELPPGLRKVIQLRELDELTTKETARIMGLSIPAVKSRVFHGRLMLRGRLKRYVAPTWMFRSGTLPINADTDGNSRSPAACNEAYVLSMATAAKFHTDGIA
jgi:RNA polymerase sigma-70 factor (ECF subfamily)